MSNSSARHSMVLFSATLFSRLTGQIRAILLVMAIGALGQVADAFDVANNIPGALNLIITSGIFNAILVPQFVKARRFKDADERTNKLLTFAITVIFTLTVLLTLTAVIWVTIVSGSNWSPEQRQLAIFFGYLCMPQVFFYGLYTLLGQVLASRERFGVFGFAPVINNVISCLGFGTFIALTGGAKMLGYDTATLPAWQILLIGLSATAGIAAQALILIFELKRVGFRYKFIFTLHGFGLRTVAKTAVWTFYSILLEQAVALWIVHVLSTAPLHALYDEGYTDPVGGNAAWTNALIIYIVPHSLITISIVTALFTRISKYAASDNKELVGNELSRGLKYDILTISFASILFIMLAVPLVRSLIPSASSYDAVIIGGGVAMLSTKLTAAGISQMCSRVLFAYEKTKWYFLIDVLEQAISLAGLFYMVWHMPAKDWVMGAGVVTSISLWSGTIIVLLIIRYKLLHNHFQMSSIFKLFAKSLVACLLSAIVGGIIIYIIIGRTEGILMGEAFADYSWLANVGFCTLVTAAMGGTYAISCKVLCIEEISALLKRVLRRR